MEVVGDVPVKCIKLSAVSVEQRQHNDSIPVECEILLEWIGKFPRQNLQSAKVAIACKENIQGGWAVGRGALRGVDDNTTAEQHTG